MKNLKHKNKNMKPANQNLLKKIAWYANWYAQKHSQVNQNVALVLVAIILIGGLFFLRSNQSLNHNLAFTKSDATAITPTLPQVFLNTSVASTPVTGQTINVPAGGNFQTALNNAQPGDEIVLQAGATYIGNFRLPVKSGAGWITIRTSDMTNLPAEGQRVNPSNSASMPKIMTNTVEPAIWTDGYAAHNFRFIGVEVTVTSALTQASIQYGLVNLGPSDGNGRFDLPSDIIFDRSYVHGNPNCACKRGFDFNGYRLAVVDSYLADFHVAGVESQGINGLAGGPFKIVNNYISSATQNVFFGGAHLCDAYNIDWCPFGANPHATETPSDIEVRHNYMFKPLSWRIGDPSYLGTPWTVKNIFELKNARRVLVDGNIMENNWVHGQVGYAILFNCVDDSGTWAKIEDVTFTNNILKHSANGFNIKGREPGYCQASRILLKNNLFDDINSVNWGGDGRLYQIFGSVQGITVDHNTGVNNGTVFITDYDTSISDNLTFTNNLSKHGPYGVFGSGGYIGTSMLNHFFTNWTFARNALAELQNGITASNYPPGNFFPTSFNAQFVDPANGNYSLVPSSPLKGQATDGSDIGVNMTTLNAAIAGVITGNNGNPPSDTTPPTVSITSPVNGATVSGTVVTTSANASDNTGVVGVQFKLNGVNLGAEDTIAPYSIVWDSTLKTNGNYNITATARDAAGNQAVSAPISIIINNQVLTPPTINVNPSSVSFAAVSFGATPAAQNLTLTNSGQTTLNWTSTNTETWCHISTGSGSVIAGGSATISIYVDAPSNVGTFTCNINISDPIATNSPVVIPVTYTVSAAPSDSTPPVVRITKPLNNSRVPAKGQLKISVAATDASGIGSITVKFNGVTIKTCLLVTGCSVNVPVNTIPVGTNLISATATDNSANHNGSNPVSIQVIK